MATGARGECTLEAEGRSYPVLFTNRALAQAERVINKPMLELLTAIQSRQLGVGDTAQLLAIGLEFGRQDAKAGGRSYRVEDAFHIMDALGFTAVLTAVLEAVAAVLVYDGETDGDQSPPA